jgi:hypothetical protein
VAITSPLRAVLRRLAGQLGLAELRADRPQDVEALVGRYGTVAVAALLILMGVGAFLTWAIATVRLGPVARVGLGVVAAAGLAAAGWRLRQAKGSDRGTRRFGDVLLALALAVVHVDAWGAGPYLGLVTPAVALAIAAAASGALALLAWRGSDQALFVVGVGGALVAPFVTSAGPGHPFVLPVYGWLVIATGMMALPRAALPPRRGADDATVGGRPEQRTEPADEPAPPWALAARLLGLAVAGYVAATVGDAVEAGRTMTATDRWLTAAEARRGAPALFALATGLTALALAGRVHRGGLALTAVAGALGALLALALGTGAGAAALAALAVVGVLLAEAAVRCVAHDRAAGAAWDPSELTRAVTGALLLPLGLLAAALVALPDAISPAGAALAAAWSIIGAAAALAVERDGTRAVARGAPLLGAHVAMAGLASGVVPMLLLEGRGVARVVALALHAGGTAWLFGRVRHRLALLPPLAALGVAVPWTAILLRERPGYDYAPFLTAPSLAAAAVVAAAAMVGWRGWRARADGGAEGAAVARERSARVALAPALALLWGARGAGAGRGAGRGHRAGHRLLRRSRDRRDRGRPLARDRQRAARRPRPGALRGAQGARPGVRARLSRAARGKLPDRRALPAGRRLLVPRRGRRAHARCGDGGAVSRVGEAPERRTGRHRPLTG